MRELRELLEEEVNRHDGNLVAVRQVNALQRAMLFCEGVDGLIREVIYAHQPNSTQLLQTRQLEYRHVCELHTVCENVSHVANATTE